MKFRGYNATLHFTMAQHDPEAARLSADQWELWWRGLSNEERQQEWAEVLQHSHSDAAPWYVIPAEHRWQRDLLLASLLAREFERLQLAWPERPAPFTAQDLELGA